MVSVGKEELRWALFAKSEAACCCKIYLLNYNYLLKILAAIQAPAPLSWIKMVPAPRVEHSGVPRLRPDWLICQFNQKRGGFW